MGRRVFSEDEVMTALCLWEALLEMNMATDDESAELRAKIKELWEDHGTYSMRQVCIDLTEDCETAFTAATALAGGEYGGSFDWDFCPTLLREKIESGQFTEKLSLQYQPRR